MPFWKVNRATGAELTEGSAARDATPHLEPISIFTERGDFDGWIVAAERRVTDMLNEHQYVRVCLDAASDEWEAVDRDEILFVAPPERATDPQRRIHRRKNRLIATVGPYVVTGTAHLPPGTDLDPFLVRRQMRFMPLTDAWVTHRTDPSVELTRPVVIVNTANLRELKAALELV